MELGFSADWVFIVLTIACVVFFFQILIEYNKQASQIRPLIHQAADVRARREEEIKNVERQIEETEGKTAELDQQLEQLEAKRQQVESVLKQMGGRE